MGFGGNECYLRNMCATPTPAELFAQVAAERAARAMARALAARARARVASVKAHQTA